MQQSFDIHFCLVSAQAAANLLPILDPGFKPKAAVFFVSNKMKENARFLSETFEKQGVKTTLIDLDDVFEFSTMENKILDEVDKYGDKNIALNVTGGTKLMAIVAQNVFSMADKAIFYMDTEKNRIIFISKTEGNELIPDRELKIKMSIQTYLSSYGASIISDQKMVLDDTQQDYFKQFILKYKDYQNLIPQLNKLAAQSGHSGYSTKLDEKEQRQSALVNMLDDLDSYGMIDFDGEKINFKNKKMKELLSGGWLEQMVFNEINNLSKTLVLDVALNLEVGNKHYKINKDAYSEKNKGNNNEFDIAFMARNKLHIIECKTSMMKNKKDAVDKAEGILYKLETLKDYGGFMTKKCLVSYFELSESELNRAKELNIEVIQAESLKSLKSRVQNWIGSNK